MELKTIIKYMDDLSKKDRYFKYSYINDKNNSRGYLFNVTRSGYNGNKSFWTKDIKRFSDLKSILMSLY